MLTNDKHAARVYLDAQLMEWLRVEAKRRCCSISQVVRDLIVDRMAVKTTSEGAK
jgi:hypothetical protein